MNPEAYDAELIRKEIRKLKGGLKTKTCPLRINNDNM